jgi:hypothetical protein
MKVFKITGFDGHWPVGTAAVVVAKDTYQAAKILQASLEESGLKRDISEESLIEIDTGLMSVHILCDGNY